LVYPLNVIEGVTETLETVSREKVQIFKNRDYSYMKQMFGYPDAKDFNITIIGNSFSANYGTAPPSIADVYAKKLEKFAINENLEQEKVTLSMTVW
jgi:hypothetical protein